MKQTKPSQLRSFAASAYPVYSTGPDTLWWSKAGGPVVQRSPGWAGRPEAAPDALSVLPSTQAHSVSRIDNPSGLFGPRRARELLAVAALPATHNRLGLVESSG